MTRASLGFSSPVPPNIPTGLSTCLDIEGQPGSDQREGGTEPSPEEIREQLDRIIESSAFETSQRNRRFLRYVVEETLAGRAGRIKAYSVATVVFGRDEDFDPQTDPIIRIEASRLRRALEHYYLSAGRDDPLRVIVPKGSYVPTFERAESQARTAPETHSERAESTITADQPADGVRGRTALSRPLLAAAVLLLLLLAAATGFIARGALDATNRDSATPGSSQQYRGPSILVAPFEAVAEQSGGRSLLGERITQDVAAGLTHFADLSVYIGPSTPSAEKGAASPRGDYILRGRAGMVEDQLRVTVLLEDARVGRQLWSTTFVAAGPIDTAESEITARIVRAIAGQRGAIFAYEVQALATRPTRSLTPYQCVLRHQLYWRQPNEKQSSETRECLERAIKTAPGYATGFAALALVRIDPIRFRQAPRAEWPAILDGALVMAQRAIDLAPNNPRGYQALHHIKWLKGEIEQSFAAATHALELNPYDTEMMAELGFRYGLRGDWSKAVPLLERAFAQDPGLPSLYRVAMSLYQFVSGRYDEALTEAMRVDVPDYRYTHVMRAIAYAQLGRIDEATESVQRILALEPRFAKTMVADLQASSVHSDLIKAIAEGLRKAGLDVAGVPTS
jgi:tetratricopeptide (TPR) repeat protein